MATIFVMFLTSKFPGQWIKKRGQVIKAVDISSLVFLRGGDRLLPL
jgi:hypothetical protein